MMLFNLKDEVSLERVSLAKTPSELPIAPPVPRYAHSSRRKCVTTSTVQASLNRGYLFLVPDENYVQLLYKDLPLIVIVRITPYLSG